MEKFFDLLPVGVIGLDYSNKILLWNSEMINLSGISKTEVNGKEFSDFCFYDSLTSKKPSDFFKCIRDNTESENTFSKTLYLEHINGKRKTVFVNSSINNSNKILDSQLKKVSKIIIVSDISREIYCDIYNSYHGLDNSNLGLIGNHKSMKELYKIIVIASETLANVLITGESGTGKELVARAIHDSSDRKSMPFIAVNCSALTETLLESELFGHVKGAFTGAYQDKPGKFEIANKGTIFLDEIGDISQAIQVKLLRVIQEKTIERVGSNEKVDIDIRIISATNKNLRHLIKNESFREDLFFRLNVFPIIIIPLRIRKTDIPLLCEHFIMSFNKQTGKNIKGITENALKLIMDYCWPGNVRELRNCIEYSFAVCRNINIDAFDLPQDIRSSKVKNDLCRDFPTDLNKTKNTKRTKNISKYELKKMLIENNGNKSEVARRLGISRVGLWKKLKKMEIEGF